MSQQPSYTSYGVSPRDKKPVLEVIRGGLIAGGAEILDEPSPSRAPFEYLIRLPREDEPIRLICYAFFANDYEQDGRPEDEHRFQVKYGGDLSGYHEVAIFDDHQTVTLFFGVHVEAGIIVACDPSMHNPTRFSKSVEFKDEHVEETLRRGWHTWERDRSSARRQRPAPNVDCRIEAIVAFRPEHLVRFIDLERITTGADPGDRLLLADKMAPDQMASYADVHPLVAKLGLAPTEILDMISSTFRLAVAVRGAAAEWHLQSVLEDVDGVTDLSQLDKDGAPDFEVTYRERDRRVSIECKNVLRKSRSNDFPVVDFQKTRASKNDPCSRYYPIDHCDILAACLHPVTEEWEYRFHAAARLERHRKCVGRLHHRVAVGGEGWEEIEALLDELSQPSRRLFS